MTTNQKPATPLPRIELGAHVEGGIFISEDDCGRVIGMIRRVGDAEQIIARANAYPLLVEALRGMVSISHTVTACQEEERKAEFQPLAEALLRTLGEAA